MKTGANSRNIRIPRAGESSFPYFQRIMQRTKEREITKLKTT
jgi:hypothetical protein